MCGRFTLTDEIIHLKAFFQFQSSQEMLPSYNISPGQNIFALVSNGERRIGGHIKWGLVPSWANDEKIGYKMINARSETIDTKPSFKEAFQKRRCLILADSFYEWKMTENGKQPYRFIMKDHKPFAFAGIWERWLKGNQPLVTCTIITTEANEVINDVHERMPVILPTNTYDDWLDRNFQDTVKLKKLLNPYRAQAMEKYEVSTLVNSTRNNSPELILPLN